MFMVFLLKAWLDAHPGWEIVIDDEELLDLEKGEEEGKSEVKAADADKTTPVIKTVDDEYKTDDGEKNYYSIAHTIHEKVTAQASILVNGKLKGSLINIYLILFHLSNNTIQSF